MEPVTESLASQPQDDLGLGDSRSASLAEQTVVAIRPADPGNFGGPLPHVRTDCLATSAACANASRYDKLLESPARYVASAGQGGRDG